MLPFLKDALEYGDGATKLLTGSTAALKGLLDLLRKPNPDLTELKTLAADAIDKLLEAKTTQMEMQNKLLKLEDELKKRSRFQENAGRYEMVKTEQGSIIYSLKPDDTRGEPPHDLCASCFENEIKSILQPVDFNTLGCKFCNARVFKPDGKSEVVTVAVRGSSRFQGL